MPWENLKLTAFILLWIFLISFTAFLLIFFQPKNCFIRFLKSSEILQVPAMILAPLAVLGWYLLTKNNLVFSVSFFASTFSMFLDCFVPALVLLFASGLMGLMIKMEITQIDTLMTKPFVLVGRSYGKSSQSQIWRIVFGFVYPSAWLKSLPLVFSELLLIEVIFNAPGLGHIAWLAARSRDSMLLAQSLGLITSLYLFIMASAYISTRRIGRLFKGYA